MIKPSLAVGELHPPYPTQSQAPWELLPGESVPSPLYPRNHPSLLNFFLMSFIFSIIVGLQCSVNFLLFSKVTQSHTHVILHPVPWQVTR